MELLKVVEVEDYFCDECVDLQRRLAGPVPFVAGRVFAIRQILALASSVDDPRPDGDRDDAVIVGRHDRHRQAVSSRHRRVAAR